MTLIKRIKRLLGIRTRPARCYGPRPRRICQICGMSITLTNQGQPRKHLRFESGNDGGQYQDCRGSGRLPK